MVELKVVKGRVQSFNEGADLFVKSGYRAL